MPSAQRKRKPLAPGLASLKDRTTAACFKPRELVATLTPNGRRMRLR